MDQQAERAQSVVERRADHDARQTSGTERQLDLGDERVENDAERHHPDDRLTEDLAQRGAEQGDADTADRSQQAGFGDHLRIRSPKNDRSACTRP